MNAGERPDALKIPRPVLDIAAEPDVRLVWENELGGLTYEVGTGPGRRFVKWTPTSSGIDLDREAARLAWAVRFTPVPVVLDQGADADGSWIVTAPLPGENAVTDRWKAEPATAVTALGVGLRAVHDALPVAGCPFSWSVDERLADIQRSAPDQLSADVARAQLGNAPPVDRLVVCHGDACSPNTLLTDDGRWSAHVDLGDLGVADPWADLAVATMSAGWNYGPGWEGRLLDAYGVEADPERDRYYRLLWNLSP
ncbi:MAG: aminoglycoside 3'-phosphotransferase [Actinomycetota bacterium]|nr:aminoglycoside 3'-phosphotransferase [Actinomycetota bacterium]